MAEETTKVSPTESYLLKRVKELEKENKKLKAENEQQDSYLKKNYDTYISVREELERLQGLCKELALEFELQTEESETFDYLRFDGSFFKTLYKDNKKNSSGEQHLINFLNYVKENLQ